jgi:hypothetical protein
MPVVPSAGLLRSNRVKPRALTKANEIHAQHSLKRLSVRFGEDSVMTPKTGQGGNILKCPVKYTRFTSEPENPLG